LKANIGIDKWRYGGLYLQDTGSLGGCLEDHISRRMALSPGLQHSALEIEIPCYSNEILSNIPRTPPLAQCSKIQKVIERGV
jgi:hypothetical protein